MELALKAYTKNVNDTNRSLTALASTLSVDRDNEKIANVYNEMNPAVLKSLEKIVTTCRKRKISCSICGQAPSVYPKMVEMLVDWGITSVSLSPDVIDKTRHIVYAAEKKLLKKRAKKK